MNHPDSEWLSTAKGLKVGAATKVASGCASSPCLRIANTETAYKAYCFACGETRMVRKVLSMAEVSARLAAQQAGEAALRVAQGYPYPREYDMAKWPLVARCWPLKAGLTFDEVALMGLYYHPPSTRVVIPVGNWYQARLVSGYGPKYLSPGFDPPASFSYGEGRVVLTEDCLSAFKVSLCGYRGWPVLGTKLTDRRIAAMLEAAGGKVIVWTDPDKAGLLAATKLRHSLTMYGADVKVVHGDRDPKLYDKASIRELLGAYD